MTENKSGSPGEIERFESDEPEAPSEPHMAPAPDTEAVAPKPTPAPAKEAPSSEAVPDADPENDELEPSELDPVEEATEEESEAQQHLRAIFGVRVEMMICVGSARPLIGDLLEMRRDALLPLNSRVQDPLEIRISDRIVGRGELKELEDGSGRLGVVVTEFSDLIDVL